MFFLPIQSNFALNHRIQETNILTKLHEDWTKNVTSRVFTSTPPPGGHTKLHEDWASNVTSTVYTSSELDHDIIGTNLPTKFHADQTINVATRVFTRQNVDDEQKMIPKAEHEHGCAQVLLQMKFQNIIGTNLLTKFQEDWKINVASRVHVFQPTGIIFQLFQDITEMNLLTKFHEDRTVNVASRVLTRKNAPPLSNLLTKFHEDNKWQMLTAHDGRQTKSDHKSSP
ncbi:hypothetical protein DPMN_058803 [Dreissena polymorpha]|uniref:Uncharacterized protein n=1 Tax=Dreissena polymorpha TaxID=45954 RepID=A0A9D4HE70_DREPO|nr:hypothetical protein DPMN_058803 [Dreissena polymorpha]